MKLKYCAGNTCSHESYLVPLYQTESLVKQKFAYKLVYALYTTITGIHFT